MKMTAAAATTLNQPISLLCTHSCPHLFLCSQGLQQPQNIELQNWQLQQLQYQQQLQQLQHQQQLQQLQLQGYDVSMVGPETAMVASSVVGAFVCLMLALVLVFLCLYVRVLQQLNVCRHNNILLIQTLLTAGGEELGCSLCGVKCNSTTTLEQHLSSRKHLAKVAK